MDKINRKTIMKSLGSQLDTILVTGGAGFIGSHLVQNLIRDNNKVKVIDNLSTGNISNLIACKDNKNFDFINKDLNDFVSLKQSLVDVKTVFHLAANPEVREEFFHPSISFNENLQSTFQLLEQIRHSKVDTMIFASSSTVYGEPEVLPTPENYGPLLPISNYGASKLACEALVSSYCNTYGIKGRILRLANIVGSRARHGVIWDFIKKLRANNKKLEILGNGTQTKSYLHVSDCIDSFFACLQNKKKLDTFNIGNTDTTDVISIAKIICSTMNHKNVEIVTNGGVDNGRGWIGDVKKMHLDISKLKRLGWHPKMSSVDAIRRASEEIISDPLVKIIDN